MSAPAAEPAVVRAVDGPNPTAGHIRVAAVQFGVGTDVEDNLATCLRMIDAAAAESPQILVLPEFSNHVSWYEGKEHARSKAVTVDGPFVTAIAAKARQHNMWIMVNCVVAHDDGRTTGTNILCSSAGEVVATSDKQVLMGSERMHLDDAIAPGPIIDTPLARLGMYSCMDGVINETPRGLALRGAQVLLNSLNSFALDEASLHIPVRAPENRVWIVAANKVGPLVPPKAIETVSKGVGVPVSRLHGAGESQIVAPDGTVVAIGPLTGDAVVVADIDVSQADDKRRPDGTDVYRARRPALYAALADAPHGRTHASGAPTLEVAVVQPPLDGEKAIGVSAELVASACRDGAQLVVLPELYCFDGGVIDPATIDDVEVTRRTESAISSLVQALAGTDAHVVTSLPAGTGSQRSHIALLVASDGVVARQEQLHESARHAGWVTKLGDALVVQQLPWGRLALVVGDDALYPEVFRLAALGDADVAALPFHVQEEWELRTGLVERSAENRINLVAATRATAVGASLICDLPRNFTLWGDWDEPFGGVISCPDLRRADKDTTILLATVHPAQASNRFVSRGTDLVDGRPWSLLDAITTEAVPPDAARVD